MADGGLPASPRADEGPGWYPIDTNRNDQAYWDGVAWTSRRRWEGAGWSEAPVESSEGIRSATESPGPAQRRSAVAAPKIPRVKTGWIVSVAAIFVIAAIVGVVVAVAGKGSTPSGSSGRSGPGRLLTWSQSSEMPCRR
jgi:hypothetical protein